MGAPVVGSELRAFIVTGGGVRFKNMAFKRRSKRVQMIFPLKGSDRRGLVSLEAKKRKVCSGTNTQRDCYLCYTCVYVLHMWFYCIQ